jgi:hypothetical protein
VGGAAPPEEPHNVTARAPKGPGSPLLPGSHRRVIGQCLGDPRADCSRHVQRACGRPVSNSTRTWRRGRDAVPERAAMWTAPRRVTPGTERTAVATRDSSVSSRRSGSPGASVGLVLVRRVRALSSRPVTRRSTSVTVRPSRSVAAEVRAVRRRDAVAGRGSVGVAAKSAVMRRGPGGSALGGGGTAGSGALSGSARERRTAVRRTPGTSRAARRSTAVAAASVIHAPSRAPEGQQSAEAELISDRLGPSVRRHCPSLPHPRRATG